MCCVPVWSSLSVIWLSPSKGLFAVLKLNLKQVLLIVAAVALLFAAIASRLSHFKSQHQIVRNLCGEDQLDSQQSTASKSWFDYSLRLFASREELVNYTELVIERDRPYTDSEQAQLLDQLAKLDKLERITLEWIPMISVRTFDRLNAMGIAVNHWGLTDYRLEKNYIFQNGNFLKINMASSQFGLTKDPASGRLWAYVDLNCQYVPGDYESPYLSRRNLSASVPIPDQTDSTAFYMTDLQDRSDLGYNFYDGIHFEPCDFRVELVSKSKSLIRIRFDFAIPLVTEDYADLRNNPRVYIDVEIPYTPNQIGERKVEPEFDFPVLEENVSQIPPEIMN